MSAVVGKHFATLCHAVKSNAMLIGDQTVIPSVDYKNRTGVGTNDRKIVESIQDKKARNKETGCA